MQFNWTIISGKIYGILKGSCDKLSMYDAKGNETIDPDEATRFFAKLSSHNPELDDFTILVAIHDEGQQSHVDIKTPKLKDNKDFDKVHKIRDGIRKSVGEREGIKINWQVFDHAIDPREEAVNNIKESKDMSNVFGTTKSSYQKIGNAKLIARHTDKVNEEKRGARSRNIKALLIENPDGERFRYPYLHVTGAKAFARHISNGGTNHDTVANKLFEISKEYLGLRRSSRSLRLVEGIDETWLPSIRESMKRINNRLKSMHGPKGYATAITSILEENSVIDTSAIGDLYNQLMEKCGCQQDDTLADDLKSAAKFIIERSMDPKPINFAWRAKPDLHSRQFEKMSERLNWQLNELAMACTDQTAVQKLMTIAEMINNGQYPTDEDIQLVRKAFESNESYIHEDKGLQEEEELNEFLDEFTFENAIKEEVPEEEIDEMRYEAGLEDHHPRIVSGVKGMKSERFKKKFRNQDQLDKWLEKENGNVDIHSMEKADLEEGGAQRLLKTMVDPQGSGRGVKIYKDTDTGEYVVKHFVDGKHQTNADYFGTDMADAIGTAEYFISHQRSISPHMEEGEVGETRMPAGVIKAKQKISQMNDAEKKEYFKGKTKKELHDRAWSHGYGKGSHEYQKHWDGVTGKDDEEIKEDYALNPNRFVNQAKYWLTHGMDKEDILVQSKKEMENHQVPQEQIPTILSTIQTTVNESGDLTRVMELAGVYSKEVNVDKDQIIGEGGFGDDEEEFDYGFDDENDFDDEDDLDHDHDDDEIQFAHPGGNSALRAASETNPRIHACPNCERPNMLTPADVELGYQCDHCAEKAERGIDEDDSNDGSEIVNGVKIHYQHVNPPIPNRNSDWAITTDNYEPGHPVGRGPTKQAAIDDLFDQLDSEANESRMRLEALAGIAKK